MKRLTDSVYIDVDADCFTLYEKVVNKTKGTKNYGKERFIIIGYYATYEQVSRKIADLGIREYIDKDWLQCVAFVDEAHVNFLKNIEELFVKRYDRKNN